MAALCWGGPEGKHFISGVFFIKRGEKTFICIKTAEKYKIYLK